MITIIKWDGGGGERNVYAHIHMYTHTTLSTCRNGRDTHVYMYTYTMWERKQETWEAFSERKTADMSLMRGKPGTSLLLPQLHFFFQKESTKLNYSLLINHIVAVQDKGPPIRILQAFSGNIPHCTFTVQLVGEGGLYKVTHNHPSQMSVAVLFLPSRSQHTVTLHAYKAYPTAQLAK